MQLEALSTESPVEDCRWAVFDEEGRYVRGIVSRGAEIGPHEDIPEGGAIIRVDRFPSAHEYWDPNTQDWATNEEEKQAAARTKKVLQADPLTLKGIIMKEVQELTYKTITTLFPDLELTKEQKAELFPMLGDES